ncbi:MAG: B12-binding domain-containing radical SAM protein [Candidatus Nitronauta litoralis]|uniref:B12-binding domain-containing radical SAM protein n=1 Tax=Candidatus Nitronauta litoralis TaxID=2705533 RepID=A0A7T0G0S9_9BACT|nr:MAG: B12-binding domain-containing radical SAM protein [Candidatus Nitronauta litoralis]
MKVLMVNPSIRPDSPVLFPNVGLGYITTAINRAGIDFEILDIDAHRFSDEEVERQIRNKQFDALAIGTLTSHYKWVKQFTQMVKQYHPHTPIIGGNTLATSVADTLVTRSGMDIAVLGEGEITVIELLTALDNGGSLEEIPGLCFRNENGQVVHTEERPVIDDIDTIPFPDWDLFDIEIYLSKSKHMAPLSVQSEINYDKIVGMPVSTARGCPFRCTFCYHAFQEKKYRHRTPENVMDEIDHYKSKYDINFVSFWDELTFYQNKATEHFADVMIEREANVFWIGSCRSDLLKEGDLHIAQKLKQSGCNGLGLALESGNDEIMEVMNKKCDASDFIIQASLMHEAGLEVYPSVIIGYPQETEETIEQTFDVCRRAKVYPSVGFLEPMPGTPMYDYSREHGYITDEEEYLLIMGDRQDLRINLTQMETDRMENVVQTKLKDLNRYLELGLEEDSLIKTRVYRAAKTEKGFLTDKTKKAVKESFLEGFGTAAAVASGESSKKND